MRNRRESDIYYFGGHHRKLKKLLCDRKIPKYRRDTLPIVCDGEGILWIPGFPPRDGTRAAPDDVNIICMSCFTIRKNKGED